MAESDAAPAVPDQDHLVARLFFRAAFPVMKIVIAEDPAMARSFAKVKARVRMCYLEGGVWEGVTLVFDEGRLDIVEELLEGPDITLSFKSVGKMNQMLRGGANLPAIKGLDKPGLLIKVLMLLMSLKLMMPSARPKDPERRRLKIKLALSMITTALSQYNKAGVEVMREWTSRQPDRVYQFTVEPVEETRIAVWLRVKAGNTKAGRGIYTRRSPFVHFRFLSVDGAMAVLLKDVGFVEGVERGCVSVEGSPEYAAQLNDHMAILQGMLT